MRKIFILFVVALLSACNSSKKSVAEGNSKYVIEEMGRMSSQDLKSLYPEANIQEGVEMYEEGTVERAYTILYPGTENELHITWKDLDRKKIYDLRYSNAGIWKSSTGIDIGTEYEELNKRNGRKISFYGFGWDYSGAVDWNGGRLENSGLRVFLTPGNKPENKFYGDKIVHASPEEIAALDLKVGAIIVNYSL